MALCSSAATTEESTPPERPSSTLPLPTCARTRAMASSMMLPTLQQRPQPQISRTKRSSRCAALLRVRHLGVELHARRSGATRRPCRRAGMSSSRRSAVKPGGSASTRSPWLIHTSSRPRPCASCAVLDDPSSSLLGRVARDFGVAELAHVAGLAPGRPAAAPWSACRSRCRAPARRARTPPAARAAAAWSVTDSGPPERMMPLGLPLADLVAR